jgi:hypothetical protein
LNYAKSKKYHKSDDATSEEIKDVKEFYTDKSNHKTGPLKQLLKELKE